MVDEAFYELATAARTSASLKLTAGAFLKAQELCVKLLKREEREEDELVKAESAMEKAQHLDCDEVTDYIAEQMVNHEFALKALQEKSACVKPFVTHRVTEWEQRLHKWAREKLPKEAAGAAGAAGAAEAKEAPVKDDEEERAIDDKLSAFVHAALGEEQGSEMKLAAANLMVAVCAENERIVAMLMELSENEKAKGDDIRTKVYRRAAQAVKAYKKPITSGKAARESLYGVGKKIEEKIDELLNTGKLRYVDKDGIACERTYEPVALAFAKKHELEFWKAHGTGENGKVMLRDMKALLRMDTRALLASSAPDSVKAEKAEAKNEAKKRKRRSVSDEERIIAERLDRKKEVDDGTHNHPAWRYDPASIIMAQTTSRKEEEDRDSDDDEVPTVRQGWE